jgi:hypothetical protein
MIIMMLIINKYLLFQIALHVYFPLSFQLSSAIIQNEVIWII